MLTRYYYSFEDHTPALSPNACSIASDEYPIIVNCAGNFVTEDAFATDKVGGREDFYLLYMVEGSMEVYLDGVAHTVSVGNLLFFPPKYHYKYVYDGAAALSYMWVHFTGSYAARFIEECLHCTDATIFETRADSQIVAAWRRIFDAYESGSPLLRHELSSALEALVISAAYAINTDGKDRSLERSMRKIHSSYNTDIRIPELAKLENMSNCRYITLFKSRMGMAPSEYIIKLRMSMACDLLLGTDKPIKEIALSVGYGDAHFFSRAFKKHTGYAPGAYRTTVDKAQGE